MENKKVIRKFIDIISILSPLLYGILSTVVIIICLFALLNQCDKEMKRRETNTWSLTKAEQKYILEELNKKNVGDCIVEPFKDGWKCTDAEGKIYIIKK